jgi:chromosome segregation protein
VRLTKLELQGFKSFADDTGLSFEPGATMIVGPNGCGKSNVSDAVRWVLGEQRARLLRGAKMEEVIFQGSSARRAVNVAEVSLHFDNADGSLPVPYHEVVITRRLSRSGESDYFLNRIPCRLRDIQDLVRGTGLGADSGVVIEAKMIDALLSDRPDDRRELFEEAAGVGLYRDRRRTTERRLEETTLDLQRLDDLIGEVQSQVRSLARQRRRAERHAELNERRFAVELTLASREMEAWKDELARLEERLVELRENAPHNDERVRNAEAARDEAHAARSAADARRSELQRLVAAQRQSVTELQGEIAVARERQRHSLQRRERAEQEKREGLQIGERVAAERERAAAARAEAESEVGLAGQELVARTSEEEVARTRVTEARAALEQAERAAREIRDRVRRAELERDGAQRELQELEQRIAALETERAQLADNLESVMREAGESDAALASATEEAQARSAELERARAVVAAAREHEASARGELFRADELLTSISGRVDALEALERERVGLAPAAARLLEQRERFGDGAILGPLSDFMTAGSESALDVERFLGATVHAVLVRDSEVAAAVRDWHAESNPGALLLLPLDAPAAMSGGSTINLQVEVAEVARGWVHALLGGVERRHEGTAFVDSRGALWLPGTGGGPGPLRRRAELFSLRAELAHAEERRRIAGELAERARGSLNEAELASNGADVRATESHAAVRQAQDRRDEVERRRLRASREVEEASELASRLAERQVSLVERMDVMAAQIGELTSSLGVADSAVDDARGRVAEAERDHEAARDARTAAHVAQAQAQARLQVAADRERRLAEEETSALSRMESLHSELSQLSEVDSQLASQMAGWELDMEQRRATLADAEQRLSDAELAVSSADATFADAEHALDETRRTASAMSDALHQAELRFTELSGRRTSIRERLELEWRKPLDELLASLTPVEMAHEELASEAETIRAQLDALGPVNPLAIEEHDEEVRRLDFLTAQRQDLADARQALHQAIREIDTTARELFVATFTQVRENFRQIFMTLFGGGECDLRLENPELPLDCDIEIHASPRGKRTQRIHLLSSGERALVALSLLFGIFLTKPSPFCLLDEVDAPLDDQNIGRFVRMLNQFKERTQFIVITHNPRTTTEAADFVYGVTMQEPGVSSVVSVRMRGAAVADAIAGRATGGRTPEPVPVSA